MKILLFLNFLAVTFTFTFTFTCWSGRGAFAPKKQYIFMQQSSVISSFFFIKVSLLGIMYVHVSTEEEIMKISKNHAVLVLFCSNKTVTLFLDRSVDMPIEHTKLLKQKLIVPQVMIPRYSEIF